MINIEVKVRYTVSLQTNNMPENVLAELVQYGQEGINLEEESEAADWILEHIKQEDALEQIAEVTDLNDGDNIWIE